MRDLLNFGYVLVRNETISAELVRSVIGLTDNTLSMDLFESLCIGEEAFSK